ncbi:MAG: 50S ribosomal protein L23 [Deltaproteobacteria bacterium]|jgi:large subunit ribosomal protein L23|nr:50S ribosomal protein L23 [Deltaproteobacteria bacterium]
MSTSRLNIIRRRLVSEKSGDSAAEDAAKGRFLYVFEVDIRANKIEIRKAFQEAFDITHRDILGLRTLIRHGKPKRRGRFRKGWRPDRKVAYLSVKGEIKTLQSA